MYYGNLFLCIAILVGGLVHLNAQETKTYTQTSVCADKTRAYGLEIEESEKICQESNEETICYVPEALAYSCWNDEVFQHQIRNGCFAIITILAGISALVSAAS